MSGRRCNENNAEERNNRYHYRNKRAVMINGLERLEGKPESRISELMCQYRLKEEEDWGVRQGD
jgi:hypothetical protein